MSDDPSRQLDDLQGEVPEQCIGCVERGCFACCSPMPAHVASTVTARRWRKTRRFLRGMGKAFTPATFEPIDWPEQEHAICMTFGHSFDRTVWRRDDDTPETVRRIDYICRTCGKKTSTGPDASVGEFPHKESETT